MRRIFSWLSSWRSYRRVVKAHRLAARMGAEFKAAEKRLRKLKRKHETAERLHRSVSKAVADEMDRMEESRKRWEEAMEILRQDNEILHELTVPNLEANFRLVYERLSAMTALEVGRRVSMSTGKIDGLP